MRTTRPRHTGPPFAESPVRRFAVLLAALFLAAHSSAQSPATNAAPPPRSSLSVIRRSPQPDRSGPDMFNNMINSAASVDMDSTVTARAEFDPPTVAAGGRATYRIVINALDESLKLPDQLPAPKGLVVSVGGRAQSYLPSGGGRIQPQTTANFRAIATNTGTFVMPSFTAMAYGKPVNVPEARLEVVAPGTPGVREAEHLVMEIPPGDIYVGQTLRIPVALVDPGDGGVVSLQQTRINGDAIFTEPNTFGLRHSVVDIDGEARAAFIQEVTITPMREGRQTLVAQASSISGRPIMVQPGVYQNGGGLVDSDPVSILVKALPEKGRLPGFSGAIGSFTVEPPRLSASEVRAGDPITLHVVVRGEGNLGRLTMPAIPRSRDWESFPPEADPAPPFVIQQRGFAMFTYTVIPLSEKLKATPAIPFCAFDPAKGSYVDLTVPPAPLNVTPAPQGAESKLNEARSDTHDNAGDETSHEKALSLAGLARKPGWTSRGLGALQQRVWFLALQLVPALGITGLLFWEKRRRFLEAHPEVVLKRRARRGLRRQLALARRAASARDSRGFVISAINAFREACAPHAPANPQALVCADVLRELPGAERDGGGGEAVRRLFTADASIRFGGPVKDDTELLSLRPDLERVLEGLKTRLL